MDERYHDIGDDSFMDVEFFPRMRKVMITTDDGGPNCIPVVLSHDSVIKLMHQLSEIDLALSE